eukprot:Nk52_evm30s914 gene=Nk52_evmTU30s914
MAHKRNLYVGGLVDEADANTVRALVMPFGEIVSVNMPLDYETQKHRGFAFVEFEESEDAAEAKFNLEGAEVFGKSISVSFANPIRGKEDTYVTSEAVNDSEAGSRATE